jgi:hypothetical protein
MRRLGVQTMTKRKRAQAPKVRRDNVKRERIPSRMTPPKYNRNKSQEDE